jgi:vacuolar-type H+-ATPase subunit H
MSRNAFERTTEHIAESAQQASNAAWGTAGAIMEDGAEFVRRAAKRGGDTAEEILNDTKQRLQRHLGATLAITLAVGLAAGALIGWMVKRR